MATLATLGAVELTAVMSESHGLAADVTEHPVEEGADAADNVRRKGDTLRLEAVVTAGSPGEVRATLEGYLDAGDPIVVVTYRRRYEQMVMTSLEMPDESKLGRAVRFTASFKQVRLVQTRTTRIRSPKRTSTPGSKDKEDGSKKVGTPASDATVRRSSAKKLVNGATTGIQKFVEGLSGS